MANGWWKRPVAEFIAIFAGVTLSFVADDWRTGRDDDATRRDALQLILEDLRADSAQIVYALGPTARYEEPSLELVRSWDDPSMSVERFTETIVPFNIANPYRPRSAAYSSLKEANNLSLIEDEELRAEIVAYFDQAQVTVSFVNELSTQTQSDYVAAIGRHGRPPLPRDPDSAWPLGREYRFESSWSELHADLEVHNLVQAMGIVGRFAIRERDRSLARNAELRAMIRERLEP